MTQIYKKIKQNSGIIFTNIDDNEGILIELRTGKYYILNNTAWCIWKLIIEGLSLEEILETMGHKYNLAPSRLRKYTCGVLKTMIKLKLIKVKHMTSA